MNLDTETLCTGLALALFIEGLTYTICAGRAPELFLTLARQKPSNIRGCGLAAMLLGFGLLWLAGG